MLCLSHVCRFPVCITSFAPKEPVCQVVTNITWSVTRTIRSALSQLCFGSRECAFARTINHNRGTAWTLNARITLRPLRNYWTSKLRSAGTALLAFVTAPRISPSARTQMSHVPGSPPCRGPSSVRKSDMGRKSQPDYRRASSRAARTRRDTLSGVEARGRGVPLAVPRPYCGSGARLGLHHPRPAQPTKSLILKKYPEYLQLRFGDISLDPDFLALSQ